MDIIFMGTPDFSIDCLDMLIKEGYNVKMVVTQPDKPSGRGHKMTPPPVKAFAKKFNIRVEQPTTLKDNSFLKILDEIKPDLIIVLAYGKILPKYILEYPKYGCINVHASLLPHLRGAAPIQWSIINGDTITGITTIQMDEGIDTGDMFLKESVDIDINDTFETLHDKLKVLGADTLKRTLTKLKEGNLNPTKQNDDDSNYAPMIDKDFAKIDWSMEFKTLYNKIRGLSPFPGAYTTFDGKRVKILSVTQGEETDDNDYGKVWGYFEDKGLGVVANGGIIYIKELQFENSKRMSIRDLLNGFKIQPGDYFV